MKYHINLILFLFYVVFAFFIQYFGFFMPPISNTLDHNCYTSLKKIAKETKTNNIAGVIIKNKNKLEIISVKKKIIGVFFKNDQLLYMDDKGSTFEYKYEKKDDYIAISGDVKYWPIYYKELEKHPKILKKIYAVTIFHYRLDVYLRPGILIKLNRSIQDLNDFYESFPEYFNKENYYIDLRNTKKVGYGEYQLVNQNIKK